MTGIVAGSVSERTLRGMTRHLEYRSAFDTEVFSGDRFGIGLTHHGEIDPDGYEVWTDGDRAGIVYGVVTNRDALGVGDEELFDRLLTDPDGILPRLNGPFLVAAIDRETDTGIVATDKLGTRPCYYTDGSQILIGSKVTPVVEQMDDPRVDEAGLQTLVMLGHTWGERTLVAGVRSLQPACFLRISDGEVSVRRYWRPDYTELPANQRYIDQMTAKYREMMEETASAMSGDVGLWLSGGLDSRSMAVELAKYAGREGYFGSLSAYTYDSNPRGAKNPELAKRVASAADIAIEEVDVSADSLHDVLDRGIETTSGLINWTAFTNISALTHLLDANHSVLLEGAGQGELMGQHLRRYHVTECSSMIESLVSTEANVDVGTAQAVLTPSVDPFDAFKSSLRRSPEDSQADVLKDVHFQNYYSKVQFANNQFVRSYVGTRVPYAHTEFLNHVTRFPTEYRMGTVPYTGGTIPYGATRPKIEFMRQIDGDLAEITYERTSVPPAKPFPVHVFGFIASTALDQLRSKPTYGAKSLPDIWYRLDRSLQSYVDALCEDACDRAVFDDATIRDLQRDHLQGEANHASVLASITTAEKWLQETVDG